MTGSQYYNNLVAGATESLAGRVAILEMLGFSLYERDGKVAAQTPFLPTKTPSALLEKRNLADTYRIIWQGAFPEVIGKNPDARDMFYSSYVRSYIERDVRQLLHVGDESAFIKFITGICSEQICYQ